MFQPNSDEAQVTFQDASTYFPDAEWRLLQEWQKELYANVMREIHQALMSLGPLIANTVFSLKAKEAQELCHVGIPLSGKRNGVNASPNEDPASIFIDHLGKEVWESNTDTNSGHETISIIIKDEEEPYCIDDPGSKRNKSKNNSAGESGSTLVKTEEGEEKETQSHKKPESLQKAAGESGSTLVKTEEDEEKETQSHKKPESLQKAAGESGSTLVKIEEDKEKETQSHKKPESLQKAAVEDIGSRTVNAVYSVSGTENSLVGKALLEKAKVTEVRSSEKGPGPSSSPLWLRNPHDLGGEKLAACETGRMRPEHSRLQQAASNVQTSDTLNDFERNLWKANLLTCQQNANIIVRPFACPECEAFFQTKRQLIVHQRTHVVIQLGENSSQERPHICAICGNSFRLRHHLIQHQRTHTGERPYQCTECKKRFTLKGNLNMHMRTHMVVYEAKHHP